ncbi:MAG: energy transducer TonB, partial [Sneathiella sp.]|nr:energy transducer TonB [Sneathiella sp.]
ALAAPKQQVAAKPAPVQVVEPTPLPAPEATKAPEVAFETVKAADDKIITAPEPQKVDPAPEVPVAPKIMKAQDPTPEVIPPPNPRSRPERFKEVTKPVEPIKQIEVPEKKVTEVKPEEPLPAQQVDKTVATENESASTDKGESLSTVVHDADYRRKTPPVYPRRAYQLGQQGTVTLHALIDTNGKPDDLKVETSSGYRLLDKAALVAVASWEFEPRIENGRRVSSWVRVPVNFRIR